ncbi:uncharacterized protein LOC108022098 [Drosophila biarmipes]|uniref:uncharacterized protein LOC108022098 n=1 Tax=Drosophila biarmipes TaxID=125945 RepID=UPI0007E7E9D2|nr:uncharacterized protein LOC108022098 [Drosophila biarmipes]
MAWNIALLICCLAGVVWSNPIDVEDCSRRQDFNNAMDCCAYPTFRFEEFKKPCGKYMPFGAPRISPCLFECIFNATNTIVNGVSDPDNVRLMLQKLIGNNHDFLEAYFNGIMSCSSTVQEMMNNRRPRPQSKVERCSPTAVFYGVCAQKYVFNHCPPSSWTGNESCEMLRWKNMNCPSSKTSRGSGHRLL